MNDLTIIYLTLNNLPARWTSFHMRYLIKAIGKFDVISISKQPIKLGMNLLQSEKPSFWNIYKQLLRGARLAKTKFIGVAEDDTLYTPEHFNEYRPKENAVSYNMANFRLYSWLEKPIFFKRSTIGNFSLIGARNIVIEALEEREVKYGTDGNSNVIFLAGEIGKPSVEHHLKVKHIKVELWKSTVPIINLSHRFGQSHRTKVNGIKVKATPVSDVIPYWGSAKSIIENFA